MEWTEPMERGKARRQLLRAGPLGIALLAVGCGPAPWDHDHLDRIDRISVRAGDTQARNITIQSVDPIPEAGERPLPGHDGRRALSVMGVYLGFEGEGTAPPGGDSAAGGGNGSGIGEGS